MTRAVYVDTSVALKYLFREEDSAAWADTIDAERRAGSTLYSSRLLLTEARRASFREFGNCHVADPLVASIALVATTNGIHEQASTLPHHLRTLDAIHLATALALSARSPVPTLFATADHRQSEIAAALGLDLLRP